MDRETLADKMIHLVEMLTNPALEVPEDLRSAFIDREIAELRASGKFQLLRRRVHGQARRLYPDHYGYPSLSKAVQSTRKKFSGEYGLVSQPSG